MIKYIKILAGLFFIGSLIHKSSAQACIGEKGKVTWTYYSNLYDDELEELYADPNYPNHPTSYLKLHSLESPIHYDNLYGSLIRGYIKADKSGPITFNITGDDDCIFYLSSDATAGNLKEACYINGWTGTTQHDKYTSQTSDPLDFIQDQYYYFEVHHVEGGGGDFVKIYWKPDYTGSEEWSVIPGQNLYDYNCGVSDCPTKGTFCSDANPNTTNDQHDGYCNCIGIPTTDNACVGERDEITVFRYDDITGSNLSSLYADADFPFTPNTSYQVNKLSLGNQNTMDNFGSLIQGFLTVPIPGDYQFNVTGNNQTAFFLSNDDDILNKNDNYIETPSSTGPTEYDKQASQTSSVLSLVNNTFYYFELNHKEAASSEHFSIFWKTPWEPNQWKRIPSIYLYNYDCTLACVPDATVCDDGNIYTNDDQYTDCECIGTPCTGEDCDSFEASYVPYEKCDFTDQLDTLAGASWISCTKSENPNPARGVSHWIHYDFGVKHRVFETQIWNLNEPDKINDGFTNVAIDYSLDGVNWTELGTYNWPLAPGNNDYGGFLGPDFMGTEVQHVLITSLDSDSGCKGISKIKFTVLKCLDEGTACDDGNPETFDDRFDSLCNCVGKTGNPNDCTQDTIMLGDSILTQMNYHAIIFLESKSQIVKNTNVELKASESLELIPGFDTESGSVVHIQLEDCPSSGFTTDEEELERFKKKSEKNPLRVEFIEGKLDKLKIIYFVSKPGQVQLKLLNKDGSENREIMNTYFLNSGFYTKYIPYKTTENKGFSVELVTKENKSTKPLTKNDNK